MRWTFLLSVSFLFSNTFSQTYPFVDGFETTVSGQIPGGYSGDIPVLNFHGLNELKGLAALLHSGDTEDSIISPLVGPLTANSVMVFYYRWVRDNIYPSQPKMPVRNDRMEVQISTDNLHFTTIHAIDSSNHQPNLNFKRVQLPLGSFSGNTIRFKFLCIRGSDRFFMDIDSVSIQNAGGIGVGISENRAISLRAYPNPANEQLFLDFDGCATDYTATIYDISGREVMKLKNLCPSPVDITNLLSGIYFAEIQSGQKRYQVKFLALRK